MCYVGGEVGPVMTSSSEEVHEKDTTFNVRAITPI